MSNTPNIRANAPPPARPGATPKSLVINGKFLQPATSRSGVYRVAKELLVALDQVLQKDEALRARLLPDPDDK